MRWQSALIMCSTSRLGIKSTSRQIFHNIYSMFLFRRKTPPPAQPVVAPTSSDESPLPITLKTLVIVYDPVVDLVSRKKLSEYMHWNKVEDLMRGYISDIQQVSGGLVQH